MAEKRFPWDKVLQNHSPSSIAPGPPADIAGRSITVAVKKTEKRARKLAQKMEQFSALSREAPAPESDIRHSKVENGTESHNGVGVLRSLSSESSSGSAGDGERVEPSPVPGSLGARLVLVTS